MSFPAYPSYKDSGVKWLGEVPGHWTVAGLKRQFAIFGGSTPKSEVAEYWDGYIPWITPADLSKLTTRHIGQTLRSITEAGVASCGTTLLPSGSIVLSTRAPIGSLGITSTEACTNQGCKALVPFADADSTFAFHALSVATEQLNVRGKGTTFLELSSDELGSFQLPFPPRREQEIIAAFLDRETAKIDALVEEQRRLIVLLKEKRQAVISHTITKGLNPDALMKDSGIEWLGEVPAHWEVTRIKHVARMESGHTPDRKVAAYWEYCDIPWVSLHDTAYLKDNDYISRTAQNVSHLGIENSSARILPAGVVVFSRDATIGRCAITTCEMAVSQHFIAWVCGEKISAPFLLLCLRSMANELDRLTSGATLKTIGMPDVRTLTIAIPDLSEQESIVAFTRRAAERIDGLIREVEGTSTLLVELRAALISAAITGKIDVRGSTNVLQHRVGRARSRGLIAAEVIERSAHHATFGRVKLQKTAYLAEAYVGVTELEGNYLREAAGPLDREMIHEMEREAGVLTGIRVEQPFGTGSAVTYKLGDRRGAHRQDLAALLGDRAGKFDKLIEDIGTIDTKGAEAVATLYAVWNDALIDGETPPDMEIKLAVLTEWHPEKAKKFRLDELQIWLDWMRRHDLIPTGTGPKTSTGRLFA